MEQAIFEGWAVVELFGHTREIGHVKTEYFGGTAMLRVDVPERAASEIVTTEVQYVNGERVPAGAKLVRDAVPARSRLVGMGAVYSLHPCTEAAALMAIEKMSHQPLRLIDVPALAAPDGPDDDDRDDPYDLDDSDCPDSEDLF